MISFDPDPEQRMLMDAAGKFAAKELREKARAADEVSEPDAAWTRSGWELGLLAASIPEKYGGFGERSALTGVLAAEELAHGDVSGALVLMAPNLVAIPVLISGSEEQRGSLLPLYCGDEYAAGASALMEPRYDFDPTALRTRATADADSFRLDGAKCNVPFAAEAEWMVVYAALGEKTEGFLVRRGTPGVTVGEREINMGLRAFPLYSVTFSECVVPASQRLGGEGGCDFAAILTAARIASAAIAVGVSRAAYEYGLEYAKNRRAFGEAIAQRQSIAFMLAEMGTDLEAARLMVWEAAWLLDQKQPASREASLARVFSDDTALMVADRAVQILGGHGYIRDYPVEMWLRNARGFAVMEGVAIV